MRVFKCQTPDRDTSDGNENRYYRVILKSAGTHFALVARVEFGPVVTPRVNNDWI